MSGPLGLFSSAEVYVYYPLHTASIYPGTAPPAVSGNCEAVSKIAENELDIHCEQQKIV